MPQGDMSQNESRIIAGRYRLLSAVGRGGMGTVWRAKDELLDRDVAIKEVLSPPGLSEEERNLLYERTMREARTAARLGHPGIVTVHDVVAEEGRPWIVMEFVAARSLQEVLDSEGQLPYQRVAEIGRQMLAALVAAHAAGVLHRDVKPSNVLLFAGRGEERAVLTDFGIATMEGDATITQTGLVMGSPAYIAPERAKGERADPASDLWSLGATLYAATEGRAPHQRTDAMASLAAILTEDPAPPANAGPLAPVLLGLLVRDPRSRIGAEMASAALTDVARGTAPQITQAQPGLVGPQTPPPYAGQPGVPGQADAQTGTVSPTGAMMASARPETSALPAGATGAFGGGDETWMHQFGGAGATQPRQRPKGAQVGMFAGIAALVVAVAALFGVVMLTKGPEAKKTGASTDQNGKPAQNSPANSTPPTSPTPTALPSGWKLSQGPGFKVGVPPGFTSRSGDGLSVTWKDPSSGAYLTVDKRQWEDPDPVTHWQRFQEAVIKENSLPGFKTINMSGKIDYKGGQACDLEFTWNSAKGRFRGYDRGVSINGEEYAIFLAAPKSQWATHKPYVDAIFNSFNP